MSADTPSHLVGLIDKHHAELLAEWVKEQRALAGRHGSLVPDDETHEQSRRLLAAIRAGLAGSNPDDLSAPDWADARDRLGEISRDRAARGSSPAETATFVFSLKQPLFSLIRRELAREPARVVDETWAATLLLDRLGLYTTEVFQKSREEHHRPPAAGDARAVDAGRRALAGHPRAAAHRHARQRAHADRDGEPARSASSRRARPSPSSTSPASRPSTRSSPSIS